MVLQIAGYRVASFPHARALMAALVVGVPDLLVLDWNLPGLHGLDLLERLRQDDRTRDLRILILSHLVAVDGELDMALQAGVLAWLEKSKTPPQRLAEKVAEVLTDQ